MITAEQMQDRLAAIYGETIDVLEARWAEMGDELDALEREAEASAIDPDTRQAIFGAETRRYADRLRKVAT